MLSVCKGYKLSSWGHTELTEAAGVTESHSWMPWHSFKKSAELLSKLTVMLQENPPSARALNQVMDLFLCVK